MDNIQSVSEVLKDPCASTWIKNAIRTALDRDPVDAANEAEYLAAILKSRARGLVHPCGHCGEAEGAGAAGLCQGCAEGGTVDEGEW